VKEALPTSIVQWRGDVTGNLLFLYIDFFISAYDADGKSSLVDFGFVIAVYT
jgi:hypothetical protein